MLDIDIDGLDDMDNRILEAMIVNSRTSWGTQSLAVAVGEESTIEEVYEPYLIQGVPDAHTGRKTGD